MSEIMENEELTEEEKKVQIRMNENDLIAGLLAAANTEDDTRQIEIARNGKVLFVFSIRALSEDDYNNAKKKHTKMVKNKQFGIKMPSETNTVRYRSQLIYDATVAADKVLLWDNKKVWNSLIKSGTEIVTPLDVIDATLRAGEKDAVIEQIDKLSGFEDNLEEVAKN